MSQLLSSVHAQHVVVAVDTRKHGGLTTAVLCDLPDSARRGWLWLVYFREDGYRPFAYAYPRAVWLDGGEGDPRPVVRIGELAPYQGRLYSDPVLDCADVPMLWTPLAHYRLTRTTAVNDVWHYYRRVWPAIRGEKTA